MPLPRLVFPERKCGLKLLKWTVHSPLPGSWALCYCWERGHGKYKEGSISFAISTQRPQRPSKLLLKVKGLSRGTGQSKKTTVKRFLSKDKEQGSQSLQKTGADGATVRCSAATSPCRRRAAKQTEASLNLRQGGGQPLPQGAGNGAIFPPSCLQEDPTPRTNLRYISQSSFLLPGYKQSFAYILGRKTRFINKCLKRRSRCSPPSARNNSK